MRYTVKCCASWCGAVEKDNPSLKFFRFPPEENQLLYDAWANYSGNERLLQGRCKQAWLCEEHFSSPAFRTGHDLVYNAIPSVPPPQESDEDESIINEPTSMDLKSDEVTDEKIYLNPTSPSESHNRTFEPFNNQFFQPFNSPSVSSSSSSLVDDGNMGAHNVSYDRHLSCNQRKRKHIFHNSSSSRIDEFIPPKRRLYETIVKRTVR